MKLKLLPEWLTPNRLFLVYPSMRTNLKSEFVGLVELINIVCNQFNIDLRLTIICSNEEIKDEAYKTLSSLTGKYLTINYWVIEVNDIWCRDYFPINCKYKGENMLLKFLYEPKYGFNTMVDNNIGIKSALKYSEEKSSFLNIPIKLDGGNLSTNGEYAIVTDKIFDENWNLTKNEIKNILDETFETKFIFIPSESLDIIGHADSIVTFLDEKTICLPMYPDEYKVDNRYINEVYSILIKNLPIDYKYIFLPCSLSDEISDENIFSAYGCFLNYFMLGNKNIFIPAFKGLEDEQREIKTILHNHNSDLNIHFYDSNEICKDGGVLHCITSHIY